MPQPASPPKTKRGYYRPELDTLRFFAFLGVFFWHQPFKNPAIWAALPSGLEAWVTPFFYTGALGVNLFFALSSFLITALLLREEETTGRLNVPYFWMRRILRIWPLYFAFIFFVEVIWAGMLGGTGLGLHLVPYLLFVGNWSAVFHSWPACIAGQLWSVSIEEQFYLVWPLLLCVFGVRHIGRLAVALVAGGWIARIWLYHTGAGMDAFWFNSFVHLDGIAFGALLAVASHRLGGIALPHWARPLLIAGGVLLPTAVFKVFGNDPAHYGLGALYLYPLTALGCALILLGTLQEPRGDAAPTRIHGRASQAFQYLGRISYGLYVFHMLGLTVSEKAVRAVFPNLAETALFASLALRFSIGLGVTIAISMVSYHFLELPFLRLKRRFTPAKPTPQPAFISMAPGER